MPNTEKIKEQVEEGELPGEQLLRCQSDIEGQGHRVAMAVSPIAEALGTGGNVSREMMNHVKAQILRAHLHLDDLEQLLASLD